MSHKAIASVAACGAVVFALWNTSTAPAAAVGFADGTGGTLTFESNGVVVGTGTFTYEPTNFADTIVAPGFPQFLIPDATLTITAAQNLRLVDTLSISLLGHSIDLSLGGIAVGNHGPAPHVADYFWGVEEPGPNSNFGPQQAVIAYTGLGGLTPSVALGSDSSTFNLFGDGWFFGAYPYGPTLQIGRGGGWRYFEGAVNVSNSFSGTWTATPTAGVPEPLTVLGSLTAAIAGYTLKRKSKPIA